MLTRLFEFIAVALWIVLFWSAFVILTPWPARASESLYTTTDMGLSWGWGFVCGAFSIAAILLVREVWLNVSSSQTEVSRDH